MLKCTKLMRGTSPSQNPQTIKSIDLASLALPCKDFIMLFRMSIQKFI